jgi:hypothetical protein
VIAGRSSKDAALPEGRPTRRLACGRLGRLTERGEIPRDALRLGDHRQEAEASVAPRARQDVEPEGAAPAPTLEELEETLTYIDARVVKWLGRRGLLRDADASNEAPSYSAGEALTLAGMQRGTLETAKESGEPTEHELSGAPPRGRDAAVHERFNLHASVHLDAHDDLGRERLCRYLARPAFSLARFAVRRDGLVVYRVKKAGRGRVKQRVMTPLECLGRLAAMVPPPRYPLLRLHGVLGPRHGWRARVVPRPPESHARCTKAARKKAEPSGTEDARPQSAAFVEQGATVVSRGDLLYA